MDHYRKANTIAVVDERLVAMTGVSTEDLRQALRRYRAFFDRLLSV